MNAMPIDVAHAQSWLRPFPEPTSHFDVHQAWLSKHIHVLALIDLAYFGHLGAGWLPLISPIEPYEGYAGDFAAQSTDPYASPNWLSFRLLPDGRLRFLGDRGWFALESVPSRTICAALEQELIAHYAAQEVSFQHAKDRYRRYGVLCRGARFDPTTRAPNDGDATPLLSQVGGQVGAGNWTVHPDPPSAFTLNQQDPDDVFPMLAGGRRFFHVASVPGWHWREAGADLILWFYEPGSRTLLVSFDWT